MSLPPSEAEQMILVKFRKQLSDLDLTRDLFQDRHLIRWLRARDLDIPKAEAMLRKSLEWREANNIDTLLNSHIPQFMMEEYPKTICGMDKDGGTVIIIPYGKWDVRKLIIEKGMKEAAVRLVLHYFEQVYKALEEQSNDGKTFKQFTAIADMEGLSFKQFTSVEIVEVILTCVRAFEANYPESLNCALAVNAPSVFAILYGMAKPFLSESTARKIQVYGPNSKKMIPAILQQINPDQLPVKYGGLLPDSDSLKSSNGNGNEYLDRMSSLVSRDEIENLPQVTVSAGSSLNLTYEVNVPNTILEYVYQTVDYDIGFSLFCENNGKKKEICHYERIKSHLGRQTKSIVCETPGKYVLSFDNTYSRMRSKALRYRVSLISPENAEHDEKFTEL